MNKCPNNPKHNLRQSQTYPDIHWCDHCKNGWASKDLKGISKNKIFLLRNLSDYVTNPDYPLIYLDLSEKEVEELKKFKKTRESIASAHQIKGPTLSIDPFFKNTVAIQRIILEQEDDFKQDELSERAKKKTLIQDNELKLNLKKCRSEELIPLHCKLIISSSGISFENPHNGKDYEHINSGIILWKDLGIGEV